MYRIAANASVVLALILWAALSGASAAAREGATTAALRAQSAQFNKGVIEVTHGVYIAVGYSASNVVLIQGDGGNIIMDTGANPVDARDIKAALGAVGRAPVRAIIYTHSHPDHTGGAKIFAGTDAPPIIARFEIPEAAIGRANRDGGDQFGMTLPESEYINAGVQMEFGRRTPPTREGYLPPTRIFSSDREALTIAGVRLELISTPGETDDTLSVWLPEKRVLVSGDNVLRTFPNIAPIRGAKMRSPEEWIASLNKLLALKADYLLPGHTRPVIGADNVRLVMTAYRDAIQSILDQTMAGMRRGERPDELVQHVRLPPDLAANPYLQEFYGAVEWMVRGLYADRLGWFDGNATDLFPLTGKERAERLLPLLGGRAKVLSDAREALSARQYKWAAELADYVLAVDGSNNDAGLIKAEALTRLGAHQGNAIARNYYLSVAQHLKQPTVSP